MPDMFDTLETIIQDRKANPRPDSYTNTLFQKGLPKVAQKVGEEATEVIVAALAQDRNAQVNELADLFYHTLVLMAQLDLSLNDVASELARRHKQD
jgi:phosphoribosyl-ATP pyrophosphohydrolase